MGVSDGRGAAQAADARRILGDELDVIPLAGVARELDEARPSRGQVRAQRALPGEMG